MGRRGAENAEDTESAEGAGKITIGLSAFSALCLFPLLGVLAVQKLIGGGHGDD